MQWYLNGICNKTKPWIRVCINPSTLSSATLELSSTETAIEPLCPTPEFDWVHPWYTHATQTTQCIVQIQVNSRFKLTPADLSTNSNFQ